MATGLVIMTPTSVNVSGGTASIRPDGGVDFSAATSLSLNGVFTSAYDNYMISVRHLGSTQANMDLRLRVSGTDASAANYVYQYVLVNGPSVSGLRSTGASAARMAGIDSSLRAGNTTYIYGPALAQPTALRDISARAFSGAGIVEYVSTHSLSAAYDGFTIFPSSGNVTGMITVYGYTQ